MLKKNKTKVNPVTVTPKVVRSTDRPRIEASECIANTRKPLLNNRERWIQVSHRNGMSTKDLVMGSGLPVEAVFRLIGKDILSNKVEFDALCEMRREMLTSHI